MRYRLALAKCLWGIQLLSKFPDQGKAMMRESINEANAALKVLGYSDSGQAYLAYFVRGQAHDWLNELSHAAHWYAKALEINSLYAPATYNAAIISIKRGDLSGAWKLLEGLEKDHEDLGKVLSGWEADADLKPLREVASKRLDNLRDRLQPESVPA